jgi:Tfp pilus assembly protein PilO
MGKMTKRKRDLLSMALSVAALVAFYFSVFRPQERAVAHSRREARAVLKRMKDAAHRIASFPGLERKIEELRGEVASVKEEMGGWSTSHEVAEFLVKEARRLRLDVSISRSDDGKTEGESDGKGNGIRFTVRMPCSYHSFAEYVETIRKRGGTVAVEGISLRRMEGTEKVLEGELTATAVLVPQ